MVEVGIGLEGRREPHFRCRISGAHSPSPHARAHGGYFLGKMKSGAGIKAPRASKRRRHAVTGGPCVLARRRSMRHVPPAGHAVCMRLTSSHAYCIQCKRTSGQAPHASSSRAARTPPLAAACPRGHSHVVSVRSRARTCTTARQLSLTAGRALWLDGHPPEGSVVSAVHAHAESWLSWLAYAAGSAMRARAPSYASGRAEGRAAPSRGQQDGGSCTRPASRRPAQGGALRPLPPASPSALGQ